MKKLSRYVFTALLLASISLTPLKAESDAAPTGPTQKVENTETQTLLNRLSEIKEIDRSTLNSTERKALRKEVRVLKEEVAKNNGGVYLSVGAIIIIILLLIILL